MNVFRAHKIMDATQRVANRFRTNRGWLIYPCLFFDGCLVIFLGGEGGGVYFPSSSTEFLKWFSMGVPKWGYHYRNCVTESSAARPCPTVLCAIPGRKRFVGLIDSASLSHAHSRPQIQCAEFGIYNP